MEPLIGKNYRVSKKIGSGSFGEIFSGTNVQKNSPVAVKKEKSDAPDEIFEIPKRNPPPGIRVVAHL